MNVETVCDIFIFIWILDDKNVGNNYDNLDSTYEMEKSLLGHNLYNDYFI